MSIVLEDVYSLNASDPIAPYGMALVDRGLVVGGAIDGVGLVTNGFLWQLYKIWFDDQYYQNLSTSWTNSDSVITTTWANDNASVTTTWVSDPNNSTGAYPP